MRKLLILGMFAAGLSGCTISSSSQHADGAAKPLDQITQEACNACPKSCLDDNGGWVDWCRGWWMDSRGSY